jgi:hypothetical protein
MCASRTTKWLAFGGLVCAIAAILLLVIAGFEAKWVGHTDLLVRFVVTDANTGRPIPNATIHIRTESDESHEDSGVQEFTLVADERGQVELLCKSCMCFGSKGLFKDTFAVHLPWWQFFGSASGYFETETEFLYVPKFRRQVQRGENSAILSVPMVMRKAGRVFSPYSSRSLTD